MIYNKKLVPTPPKTIGRAGEPSAKKLTDAGDGPLRARLLVLRLLLPRAADERASAAASSTRSRKPPLNSPENVKSLELLMKWVEQGPDPAGRALDGAHHRRCSTRARRPSSSPARGSSARSPRAIDYGLAPLPTIDEAGGKPMRPWMTVEGVYIAAPSKNKDAAYDFAKYVTDLPQRRRSSRSRGDRRRPTRRSTTIRRWPATRSSRPSASRSRSRCRCPTCRR